MPVPVWPAQHAIAMAAIANGVKMYKQSNTLFPVLLVFVSTLPSLQRHVARHLNLIQIQSILFASLFLLHKFLAHFIKNYWLICNERNFLF